MDGLRLKDVNDAGVSAKGISGTFPFISLIR